MKLKLTFLTILIAALGGAHSLNAGTPEQDKAFVDSYKAAFESGDKAKLESFLYTKDAQPMALEFFKMMQQEGAGNKISKIELVELSPQDLKKADEVQEGPGGVKMKMPLKATKKLKMTVETKDENGSSSSSSENLVAEKDGKYVIPVPVAAK